MTTTCTYIEHGKCSRVDEKKILRTKTDKKGKCLHKIYEDESACEGYSFKPSVGESIR